MCEPQLRAVWAEEQRAPAEVVDRQQADPPGRAPDRERVAAPKVAEEGFPAAVEGFGEQRGRRSRWVGAQRARKPWQFVDGAGEPRDGARGRTADRLGRADSVRQRSRPRAGVEDAVDARARAVRGRVPLFGYEKVRFRFGVLIGKAESRLSPSRSPAVSCMRSP